MWGAMSEVTINHWVRKKPPLVQCLERKHHARAHLFTCVCSPGTETRAQPYGRAHRASVSDSRAPTPHRSLKTSSLCLKQGMLLIITNNGKILSTFRLTRPPKIPVNFRTYIIGTKVFSGSHFLLEWWYNSLSKPGHLWEEVPLEITPEQ